MPKQLLIIRHAKAEEADFKKPDFKRALSHRGEKNAQEMAKRLKTKNLHPQILYSSPALRAISTARYFAHELGIAQSEIIQDPEIYDALTDTLLDCTNNLDDQADFVALFGHNPSITDLVNKFCGADIDNIPTCGIALILFPFDSWKMLSGRTGELILYDYPKNEH
ncbi:histidine phosphatase family protein [Daejeonella sp.]|uniref:SixA phosphatase family protein n=1 Tax=Daejeonella sp. TaxID=2805397 RepID=UPI002724E2F3|nr:histidine phosphatase family protein [Daejeonella sp.]MDO8991968.1 histidine phosphatase family protein [Daejeonella sp.]MDP2412761.1 histidine phosphatase family protein [Daejeonella sp.]